MATTYHLERVQFIPRSRHEVFGFFSNAANLEKLTPPFLRFEILSPLPIVMRPGALIDYRLNLYGLPVHWQTEIATFDPENSFSDVQLKGPYRKWHHLHQFSEVPGGTEMRDAVDYEIPFGLFGRMAHPLFVRRSLQKIFDYRWRVVEELFGKGQLAGSRNGAANLDG